MVLEQHEDKMHLDQIEAVNSSQETCTDLDSKKDCFRSESKCCMKLLSTALHQAISIKQLRDLYIHVAYTIHNYLGRPSDACIEDTPELCRYASQICPDLTNKEKKNLWIKAETLPPPAVQIFVEVIKAELAETSNLKGDKVFCVLGTNKNDRKMTTEKAFSMNPQWRENFIFNAKDFKGGSLTIEMWMATKDDDKPVMIGEACQDLEMVPCTGDELWLSLDEHNDPTAKRGYLTLRCCLQVECQDNRLPVIYRHLLMCRFCFEHELQASQRLYLDIPSSGAVFPTDEQKKGLYQHGLCKVLPSAAVTFLHQHATQSGLSPWENQICCWLLAEHFYRSGFDINTGVVHALLHEVTVLGAAPQRPLEPQLKALLLLGIEASVSKCCCWLRGIHAEIQEGGVIARKELEHVIRYLLHMETFYIGDAVEKATEAMQQGSKQWVTKTLGRLDAQVQDWRSLSDTAERFLLQLLELHKILDPIFWRVWEKRFTDIVARHVDAALKENLGCVMEDMAEQLAIGKQKYSRGIVNQLVEIFIAVRKLGYYVVQQLPPASAREALCVESCYLWVGSDAFLMYLRQRADDSTQWLVSWIESGNSETSKAAEKDALYRLIRQLLRAWRELIWPDPRPSTVALVQVVRKTASFCCQHINSYVTDQSFFCSKKHFTVTPQLCSALCKLDKIEVYCTMVKDEVKSRVKASIASELLVPLTGISFDVQDTTKYICGHMIQRVQRVVESQVKLVVSAEEGISASGLLELQKYSTVTQEVFQQHLTEIPYFDVHSYVTTMIRGILKGIQPMDGTKFSRFQKVVYVLQSAFKATDQKEDDKH